MLGMLLQTEKPPLVKDQSGALRVGGSQVLLEIVINAFEMGATPETIVQQYPTVTLANVYSVIGYYLRHKNEVEAYLTERDLQAQNIRDQLEQIQPDLSGIRKRLQNHKESI